MRYLTNSFYILDFDPLEEYSSSVILFGRLLDEDKLMLPWAYYVIDLLVIIILN